MPRPTKCRMICRFPQTVEFAPAKGADECVIMTLDEYEAIRLIDKESLSQEECAKRMQVARTTAQKIYDSARKKLADALVDGLSLKIEGGEYKLCGGENRFCTGAKCYKKEINRLFQKSKGGDVMRIAVTYENGQIFQHFGHTEHFKLYDVRDGKIISSEVVDTNGQGHGALAEVLRAMKADALICGGIGGGARFALEDAGITLYGGTAGDSDAAVEALLAGNLSYNPDIQCSHHEDRHGENHDCRHGKCSN